MFSLRKSPLELTTIFYPINGIPYIWMSPLNELIGVLLLPVIPLPVLFNILALLPVVLGAYFTYKIVFYLTKERIAGITSGILFGFSPFVLSTMMGNLSYASIEFIPLVVFTMIKLKDEQTTRNGTLFIIASLLLALSCSSYIFYAYIPLMIYLPVSWLIKGGRRIFNKIFLLYILLGIALVALFAIIFYMPQLNVIKGSGYVKAESMSQLLVNNQNFLDYLLPNKANFFFSKILYFISQDQAYFSNIGMVTLFLLILVIAFKYETTEVIRWGVLAVLLYAFSLGPYLRFNGLVTYPYYGMLHFIPLPYLALTKLKWLSHLTQPALLIPLLLLCTSVIAGFGVKLIIERTDIKFFGYITSVSLIVLSLAEYYPGYPFPSVQAGMPMYYMPIEKDNVARAIIELPVSASVFENKDDIPFIYRSMYYQMFTNKALVGGYYNYQWDLALSFIKTTPFLSELNDPFTLLYGDIIPVNRQSIADYGIRELSDLGVGYIIVNRVAYNQAYYNAIENFIRSYCGEPLYNDGYVSIFVITRTYLSVYPGELTELGSGWYAPALNDKDNVVFRMMSQDGTIKVLGVKKTRTVKLVMGIIRPFKSIKTLVLNVNGKTINKIDLDATGQPVTGWESAPFRLEKGDNTIIIHSMDEPVNPYKELAPFVQDTRPVTIGVFGLRLSGTTTSR